ncbi:MAG TPA: endospore germination permease [Bacillota bacterium]|nr:endospore germination permease [Bacillota bacterium]
MNPLVSNPRLSPAMFFVLLLVSLSGLDFLTTPYDVAKVCGPSAHWAILGSWILILPLIGLMILFKNRFPEENLLLAATRVLGKPLAMAGNMLFLSVFLIWLIVVIPNAGYLISTYLLDRTPILVIEVALLMAIGYIAINGLKSVCRMAAFIVIPTIAFRLFMKTMSLQNVSITYLLPLFSNHPWSYLNGALATFSQFLPLSSVFLIYPLLKKPSKLGMITLGAASAGTIIVLLGVIGTIGIFSAPVTERFSWPNLEAVHTLSVPYLVMEQFGLLFIIVWLTMFFIGTSFYFNLVADGLKQQIPVLNYRYTVLGLLILVGVGGFVIFPNIYRVNSAFTTLRHFAILPTVVYPLIIYGIDLLKGKRGQQKCKV